MQKALLIATKSWLSPGPSSPQRLRPNCLTLGSYLLHDGDLMQSEMMTYTHCQNCSRWFRIGIRYATAEAFQNAKFKRATRVCPFCKKVTPVKKQYFRFDESRIDGRVTHTEGKYFL